MELFSFLSLHQFEHQIEVILPHVRAWQVRKMKLEKRHQVVLDYECYLRLLKIATNQSLNFQAQEIVSWLDNIVMVDRLISRFPDHLTSGCSLAFEYHLMPSRKRIDVLFYQNGKYVLLETTYDDKTINQAEELAQLQTYQDLLKTQLGKACVIQSVWMPIIPEYDERGRVIDPVLITKNNQVLDEVALKMVKFLS